MVKITDSPVSKLNLILITLHSPHTHPSPTIFLSIPVEPHPGNFQTLSENLHQLLLQLGMYYYVPGICFFLYLFPCLPSCVGIVSWAYWGRHPQYHLGLHPWNIGHHVDFSSSGSCPPSKPPLFLLLSIVPQTSLSACFLVRFSLWKHILGNFYNKNNLLFPLLGLTKNPQNSAINSHVNVCGLNYGFMCSLFSDIAMVQKHGSKEANPLALS